MVYSIFKNEYLVIYRSTVAKTEHRSCNARLLNTCVHFTDYEETNRSITTAMIF